MLANAGAAAVETLAIKNLRRLVLDRCEFFGAMSSIVMAFR
jgi:hypothetical protein